MPPRLRRGAAATIGRSSLCPNRARSRRTVAQNDMPAVGIHLAERLNGLPAIAAGLRPLANGEVPRMPALLLLPTTEFGPRVFR